jgi:acetyl esterase
LPAIIYIHGGGWILGDESIYDRLIRQIANEADAAVVFVNYTPSPEAHYPVALEQAYTAASYVAAHGSSLNLDASRMAVAGDSVGGNMATALTMLAKQRGGPHLRYQALFYPVTDAKFTDASYQEFANGPWLTKTNMEWFWQAYIPNPADRLVPTASPLEATPAELQGLPPAMVITDENDVLRDEGEAYAHKLMQAGVTVTAVRYLGAIHDFVMLNALAASPEAIGAVAQASAALHTALAG